MLADPSTPPSTISGRRSRRASSRGGSRTPRCTGRTRRRSGSAPGSFPAHADGDRPLRHALTPHGSRHSAGRAPRLRARSVRPARHGTCTTRRACRSPYPTTCRRCRARRRYPPPPRGRRRRALLRHLRRRVRHSEGQGDADRILRAHVRGQRALHGRARSRASVWSGRKRTSARRSPTSTTADRLAVGQVVGLVQQRPLLPRRAVRRSIRAASCAARSQRAQRARLSLQSRHRARALRADRARPDGALRADHAHAVSAVRTPATT